MPCSRKIIVLALTAVLAVSSLAWAQSQTVSGDWPQWRGPDRTGVSTETGLLKEWPKDGPKLLWKATDLGGGHATPAVSNGRIYLMGSKDNEEYLMALDAKDGKPIWSTKVGAVGPNMGQNYPGPRSTPTVDGDWIYTLGSDGDLVCAETATGKLVWRKNYRTDFQGQRGFWAFAESPLVDGDVLVCTPGGPKATMVALNKKTGDVIWTSAIDWEAKEKPANEAGYASPIAVTVNGVKQYVQFLRGGVVSVDAKTGKLLWRYDKTAILTNCATPIFHDGHVFVSTNRRGEAGGGALLRLSGSGSSVTAQEIYLVPELGNHHGGVVRVGDYLYGTNQNGLVCLDFKTGKVMWQDRSVGKGSVSAADGHLYVRGENGPVALVEATSAGYREKGRFDPPGRDESQEKFAWPHPVVAGGRLYLRDGNILLCYDVKAH